MYCKTSGKYKSNDDIFHYSFENNDVMKQIFIFFLLFLLISCGKKQVIRVKNEGSVAKDSTLLVRQDSVIKINIGGHLRPSPSSSQIVQDTGNVENYVFLDENSLHWFDLKSGKHLRSKKIEKCGNLNNYSGFLCLGDTTFVYNYKQKMVYMLDSLFEIQKTWNVVDGYMKKNSTFDPEALTDSPMMYVNGKLLLSGAKIGQQKDDGKEHPISCCIDMGSDKVEYGGNYPKQYLEGDFGGVYFNMIYHTMAQNCWWYSFPASHEVYASSLDLSESRKFYMGSRYAAEIVSSDYNSLELFKNKELRIRYYISQHSYSNLLYDKYRKLFYRIALHPLSGWQSGAFLKPFSIIVMDMNGNLLSETPIQKDYANLNLHNMHITKDGLLIQRKTLNEDVIEFVVYNIVTDEK